MSRESRPITLSPPLAHLALDAAKAVGLEIAGVDLIIDRDHKIDVIEVNYSPGFQGLEAATGLDIAGKIVDYLADTY